MTFIIECVQEHSSNPGVILFHRTMIGPFLTLAEAEAWVELCGVPAMYIHTLKGPNNALIRGNAQVEDWKTPFWVKKRAES